MRMPAFDGPAPVCYSSITSTVAALREVSQQNRGYRSKMFTAVELPSVFIFYYCGVLIVFPQLLHSCLIDFFNRNAR